jgi:Tfp pilus assembly protein PilO
MSGNNCDDAFQQIRELRDQNRELQKQADDMERQLRAAGVYSKVVTGDGVIVPGQNGPLELKVADVRRSYQQLAGKMSSQEVAMTVVARGFDTAARPVGSEGRFLNYDRLLQQVQVKNKEDFARFVEALGILSRDHTPDDFAFLTEKYGRDRSVRAGRTVSQGSWRQPA